MADEKFIISSQTSSENLGELADLRTTEKGSVVRALNEVNQKTLDVVKKVSNLNFINVKDYGAKGDGVTDDTDVIQSAVADLMKKGGGTLYFPAGEYLVNGTIYTHQDSYSDLVIHNPIELRGAVPVSDDLNETDMKGVTRIVKKVEGFIIGANYTTTKEVATTEQWKNFSVRNIAFMGTGTFDSRYNKIFASVRNTEAIDARNTSLTVEDCYFYALRRAVNQQDYVKGVLNNGENSVYRRLGFKGMGLGCLRLVGSNKTVIESLNLKDLAMTASYGVYSNRSEGLSIRDVSAKGKGMHLCKSFKFFELASSKNANIDGLYAQRVEGLLLYAYADCVNISLKNVTIKDYFQTLIKARDTKNLIVDNFYSQAEEGVVLSTADPGNYTAYTTQSQKPTDFDIDSSCLNVKIGKNFILRNSKHTSNGGALIDGASDEYRYSPDSSVGFSQGYSTTYPSVGVWGKGSIVYNSNPGVGKPIGWVCVNAGTPGTWLPFGDIHYSGDVTQLIRFKMEFTGLNTYNITWYSGKDLVSSIVNDTYGMRVNLAVSAKSIPKLDVVHTGSGGPEFAGGRIGFIYRRNEWNGFIQIGMKESVTSNPHIQLSSINGGSIEINLTI